MLKAQSSLITRQIELSGNLLEYNLLRSRRRTIQIIVFPNQTVEVRAPIQVSISHIQKVVEEKKGWILKKREQFKKYPLPASPRKYISGEKHRYLGKQYELTILKSSRNFVSISEGNLNVHVKIPKKTAIKSAIDNWYLQTAKTLFPERLEYGLNLLKKHNLEPPLLKIRKMKSRWGSCSGKDIITLNLELIKYPVEYIDYVVVHELSHLVEHNHSKRFYKVLSGAMPDWKERQQALNKNRELKDAKQEPPFL
ncbi:MAG: M48 family metallopeptidase [Spirochaetia bacterium]|nr:M48 family metallopeptidase [Spirochaetia bacterium]